MELLRKCTGCGLEAFNALSLKAFVKDAGSKFKHRNRCNVCNTNAHAAYYNENKTALNAAGKIYYQNNKQAMDKCSRRYVQQNQQKVSAYQKQHGKKWRTDNPELVNGYTAKYRATL